MIRIGESYTYKDVDITDYVNYYDAYREFLDDKSNDELIKILNEIGLSDDDKEYVDSVSDEDLDRSWAIDVISDTDYFDESDIYDAYVEKHSDELDDAIADSEAYRDDPYGYYGVDRSDFF